MNILEKIFPSHELEELLYVLFTSNKDMDEKYIKESFLKFDSVFRILGISNEINKKNYVNKRVFALNNEICTYLIKKLDSFSRDLILVKGIKSHPVVGDHNCIVQNCSQSLNIINEMESKIIFLIGPIGYGKSTTGCTLLRKRNAFTSGSDIQRVTGVLRSQVGTNGMLVIDSPGVGDASDDTVFQEQFLKNKNYLLNILPIDAFILIIKFDENQSGGFFLAAQQYFRYFGRMGIKSLMILCIQGNPKRIYSNEDFRKIFLTTDGYKFLLEKNDGIEIPYCLWDNFNSAYYNDQEEEFRNKLNNLQKIDQIRFQYICDMLENDISRIKESQQKDEIIRKLNAKIVNGKEKVPTLISNFGRDKFL
jgi:hypothetical protein